MSATGPHHATHQAIDAVWRIESPRLIAGLTRLVRDIARAEDLAQDALVAALEQWPATGIPDNPGAWLMATAKNRAIDQLRRQQMRDRKHEEIEEGTSGLPTAGPDLERVIDEDVGLVLRRQVDRGPASVGTPALLGVHRVDEMSEVEFRRPADRVISPAGAPEQHGRAGLAEAAKHLQGPGPQ